MSLRYALLGLLAEEPARRVRPHPQVRAETCSAMPGTPRNSPGLPPSSKKPRRTTALSASSTPARRRPAHLRHHRGRAAQELRRWMRRAPPDVFLVRNEFVLRLFLLTALEPDEGTRPSSVR